MSLKNVFFHQYWCIVCPGGQIDLTDFHHITFNMLLCWFDATIVLHGFYTVLAYAPLANNSNEHIFSKIKLFIIIQRSSSLKYIFTKNTKLHTVS